MHYEKLHVDRDEQEMVVPRLYLVRGRRLIYLSFLISRAGGTASASTAEEEEDTDN